MVETTVGRVLFNDVVPQEVGFINQLLTKKSLRDIIGEVVKLTGMARTAQFLDDIKEMGFQIAFKGGLSFNLLDLTIPEDKVKLISGAQAEVDEVWTNYNMGFITNNERYNKVIDSCTRIISRLTDNVLDMIATDYQGFK